MNYLIIVDVILMAVISVYLSTVKLYSRILKFVLNADLNLLIPLLLLETGGNVFIRLL